MAADFGHTAWDIVAPVYDLQARLEKPALRAALELAAVAADDRVLDAGCGTGQWLRMCAGAARPRRLVGVDRSSRMLARAREAPAELVTADLRTIPLEDGSFDIVCCAFVLHLLEAGELAEVLLELHRVLGDQGRLVTVTPMPAPGALGWLRHRAASLLAGTRLQAIGGLRPYDPRDALDRAGFRVDATISVAQGYASLCTRSVKRS